MSSTDMLRMLTFTSLYPNNAHQQHGIFVETRLRELLARHDVSSRVIAPVPWFPFKSRIFGDYARFAQVSRTDTRHGIDIVHPRFVVIPKIGMSISPFLLAVACIGAVREKMRQGYEFDVIDAHYFYPDGVAAAILGAYFGKPVIVTARGSDINYFPTHLFPRLLIKMAIKRVDQVITVSAALKDRLINLGCDHEKITIVRNGVDLDFFQPAENRSVLRSTLGLKGKVVLSVGRLVPLKGHDLTIRAIKDLPDTSLVIAGNGEEKANLLALVEKLEMQDRVLFLGSVSQSELKDYYAAADLQVLASESEGWANVLLESMSCGTAVVATDRGGTPEVVQSRAAGILVKRDVASIRDGIERFIGEVPDRLGTRSYAEQFGWDEVLEKLHGRLEKYTKPERLVS